MSEQVEEIRSVGSTHSAMRAAFINNAPLNALLEAMADGVVVTDERGTIAMYNQACETLFGYSPAEAIGASFDILVGASRPGAHGYPAAGHRKQTASQRIGAIQELEGRRKNGTTFQMELSVGELDHGGARYLVRTVRDIDERTGVTDARVGATENHVRSKAELDSFVYAASHDLKAPLRAIDNLATWIDEDLGETLQGKSRDNMALLRGRVRRLEALLDDVLEFCRAGRADSVLEIVDTQALVREVCATLDPDNSFDIQFRRALPAFETASAPFEQVLRKLIGNAIKHHDRGAGTISFDVQDKGSFYEFFIADDGPGFAPEFRDKVWQAFQTLRPRDQVEGSGMGLAVVKKTVESYGGEVFVESEHGAGATFGFSWPKLSSWGVLGE